MTENNINSQLQSRLLTLIFLLLIFVIHTGRGQEQTHTYTGIFEVREKETNLILDGYHINEYDNFINKYQEDYEYNRIDVIVMYSHDDYNETVTNELNRNGLSYNYLFIEDCY